MSQKCFIELFFRLHILSVVVVVGVVDVAEGSNESESELFH